jgi:uncharacterized protein YjbJ (UPF0337 family)
VNRVEGTMKNVGGKVEEDVGRLTPAMPELALKEC